MREPLKGYERTDHADVRNPETHDVGLQRPCRVHPEMPAESVVSGNPAGVGGTVFRSLAEQWECRVEEGHLMPDHVHMLLSVPPKYSVSNVMGFIKGKSAIHIARV